MSTRRRAVLGDLPHAATRGVVAAMSMSGLRMFAGRLGLLERTPPEMIVGEHAPATIRDLSQSNLEATIIALHWAYGAGGGAAFGMLPEAMRRRAWAGPIYGVVLWIGFEAVIAPLLGLHEQHSLKQRAVLMADHLLYGAVLSELRRRPQQ